MLRFRFIAVLLSLSLGGAALAQQPTAAPAPAPPPTPWQVDWGSHFCSMIRQPGEGRPFSTAIAMVPGAHYTDMILLQQGSGPLPQGITSVVLMPSGQSFAVTSRAERRGQLRVIAISGLPRDFRDSLAGTRELQLKARDETRARIPTGNLRAVIAAHRRCVSEVLRMWGIDEAALAALSREPSSTNLFGLNSGDYPEAALRTATQGRVIVRFSVSAEGRATECRVVATSGNAAIDATTCRVAMARGRFQPGLDAAGTPVATRSIFTVTWRVPSS